MLNQTRCYIRIGGGPGEFGMSERLAGMAGEETMIETGESFQEHRVSEHLVALFQLFEDEELAHIRCESGSAGRVGEAQDFHHSAEHALVLVDGG